MEELTVGKLINYFVNKLQHTDRNNGANHAGNEPYYPMLVVYLGEKAISGHELLSDNLFCIWPQYREEIKFLGIVEKKTDVDFIKPGGAADDTDRKLKEKDVADMISSSFGLKMHFSDRKKILIYFVLDSEDISGIEYLKKRIEGIKKLKNISGLENTEMSSMLILMLDESGTNREVARTIRNFLCGYNDDSDKIGCQNVLLLSNRRDDNVIMEDKVLCWNIAAAVIRLSDNHDARIRGGFFRNNIITAGYAREEKPLRDIGTIVVTGLTEKLRLYGKFTEVHAVSEDDLRKKTEDSFNEIYKLISEYINKEIAHRLPDSGELQYFPRSDDREHGDIERMSSEEFDKMTMGAWSCYLRREAEKVKEEIIKKDSAARADIMRKYKEWLAEKFSPQEIIRFSRNMNNSENRVKNIQTPSADKSILDYALSRLTYDIVSDGDITEFFRKISDERSETAVRYMKTWSNLEASGREIFNSGDTNITKYYKRIMTEYFDYHGNEINSRLKSVCDADQLCRFMENEIDRIIMQQDIFRASFEEELGNRLREDAIYGDRNVDVQEYIREKLMGRNKHIYIQVNFVLGESFLSSVMIEKDTKLCENLRDTLPPDIYYYDTGNGNAVESVFLYDVGKEHLIT